MVVVVVLGILATLAIVAVGRPRASATTSACAAEQRKLVTATYAYFSDPRATAIPAAAGAPATEEFEQTLVDQRFIQSTSDLFDLDENGELSLDSGSSCTLWPVCSSESHSGGVCVELMHSDG